MAQMSCYAGMYLKLFVTYSLKVNKIDELIKISYCLTMAGELDETSKIGRDISLINQGVLHLLHGCIFCTVCYLATKSKHSIRSSSRINRGKVASMSNAIILFLLKILCILFFKYSKWFNQVVLKLSEADKMFDKLLMNYHKWFLRSLLNPY